MKIIITETQSLLIDNIMNNVVSEEWNLFKTREILEPNQKPSLKDPSKGLYRKMIEDVLSRHSDSLKKIGVENRSGHYFMVGSDEHSPLTYMNTHYVVAKILANYFNVPTNATKEEAVKIIGDGLNREFDDIFVEGNKPAEEIYGALSRSKTLGDKNEIIAKDYIIKTHSDVFASVEVVAETGGSLDKGGVDIVATTKNGRKIYYQVKPFKYYAISPDGNGIIFGVNGRTPVYPHHNYWIFINGDKILEVRAKNLKPGVRQRDVMFLPKDDIVSKTDNLKPWVPKNKEL